LGGWHQLGGLTPDQSSAQATADVNRIDSWFLERGVDLRLGEHVLEHCRRLAETTETANLTWANAETELLNALGVRQITAIGSLYGRAYPCLIDAAFWPTATFLDRHLDGRGWQSSAVMKEHPHISDCYCDLRFEVREILKLWPQTGPPAPSNDCGATQSPCSPTNRKRGPKPTKLEQVKAAMRRKIEQAVFTYDQLLHMKQDALATEFGASRDTVARALEQLRPDFVGV
jgi:hypothetical protein